jgi:hypothetical protein
MALAIVLFVIGGFVLTQTPFVEDSGVDALSESGSD